MMLLFQYRDPLIGVLDYIVEVRLSEYGHSHQSHSVGSKRNISTMSWAQIRAQTRTTWPLHVMMIFSSYKTWYLFETDTSMTASNVHA